MPLFGNYAAMHRLGDALNNLAEAARLMASCADWIALRIEACWMGNAADGAWLSIRHLALALAPAERVLKELGAAYTTVVEDIKELEDIMEMIIGDLLDAAFFAALAIESTPTIIGPVVLGGATVVELIKFVKHCNDLLSKMNRAQTIIDIFDGKLTSTGLLDGDLPNMPAVPTQ